jgi:hypothetical protein
MSFSFASLNAKAQNTSHRTTSALLVSTPRSGVGSANRIYNYCRKHSNGNAIACTLGISTAPEPAAPLWVGGGQDSITGEAVIYRSLDGDTWTRATDTRFKNKTFVAVRNIFFYNGIWLACFFPNQLFDYTTPILDSGIAYSMDGNTWLPAQGDPFTGPDFSSLCSYIGFHNGTFVACGFNGTGNTLAISSNGKNWSTLQNDPFYGGNANYTVFSRGRWLVCGNAGGSTINVLSQSTDNGKTWTNYDNVPLNSCNLVAENNEGVLVAGGVNNDSWNHYTTNTALAVFQDNVGWTSVASPFQNTTSLVFANGIWVASNSQNPDSSHSTNTLMVCPQSNADTTQWKTYDNDPFAGGECYCVLYVHPLWVACGATPEGTGSTLAYSTDNATTWNTVPPEEDPFFGGQCYSLAFQGTYWEASGVKVTNGTLSFVIARSTEFRHWKVVSTSSSLLFSLQSDDPCAVSTYLVG